ncbi:MAG: dienelactone hydrolase family protein [Pseudomonadota bacterium]|nr:MAG: dienelactone hydrolase family protein [Pseudomonadota bacterium]
MKFTAIKGRRLLFDVRRVPALLSGALVLAILGGCAAHTRMPFDPEAPQSHAFTRGTSPQMAYTRQPVPLKNGDLTHLDDEHYRVKFLRFPAYGKNGQKNNLVTAHYYKSKLPGKKKLVIVLPIWGVSDYPSVKIAEGLREHSRGDTNIIELLGERYLIDWEGAREATTEQEFLRVMRGQSNRFRDALIDIRRVIDWSETQPDIDPQRIAVIGFSIGAMIASSAVANEPRLAAAVLVMGGAHPQDVFATCLGRAGDLRTDVITRFDWTIERYLKELTPVFTPVDPAQFPGRVDPSKILIFDAKYDDCIPRNSRDDLWEAMGRPERGSIINDHQGAFFAMTPRGGNFIREEIYTFLDRVL